MSRSVTFEGITHQFPDDATDSEVSAALESAHPASGVSGRGTERLPGGVAPGLDKPAIPAALQADKPEFTGDSYGSELPIPSSNFATDGLSRVGDGLTKIGAGPYSGVEQKNGVAHGSRMSRGISNVVRGAGEIASPLAPGLIAAAPVAALGGAAGGAVGEGVGRGGAALLGGDEDQQNAAGDVLGMAGAHYGGKTGDMIRGAAPRYLNNRELQDATVDMIPYFGGKLNKLRSIIEGIPSPIRPLPEDHQSRFRIPGWDGVQDARSPIIAEPGSKIGQNPFANPLDPAGPLPSGKVPGGIHNVLEPIQRPERPPALWQQYGAGPVASESSDFTPIQGDLPSGRYPVSSRFPEPAVPPRPARIPGWMERGISVAPDQPADFTPIRGAHPSGRAPGAFDVPHQSQILPQSIRPVPLSESPDMSDILQQSIDRIKARKNDSPAPSDIPLGSPLKVRRRK